MMPVVCTAAAVVAVVAAAGVIVFNGLRLLFALAEELLIKASANNAAKAIVENVNAVNNLFAVVFIIKFLALSQI